MFGNLVDKIGTGLNLPEWGISEALNNNQRTAYTGITPQSQAKGFGYNPANPTHTGGGPGGNFPIAAGNKGSVLGATATSGGGGGSIPMGNTGIQAPQGPSQEDINREIDNAYNGSFDYLNQAESAVRADHPNALKAAEEQFLASQGQLQVGKNSSLNSLGQQETQGTRRKEDALSAARRLYDEVSRGAMQRFGGSSSAGQAASELQGREAQRSFGDIGQNFNDFVQVIGQKKQEVEDMFQSNVQQLMVVKNQAINEANRDFQNKLLEIANNRAQIGQAKAQARLGALQDLRNKVYAIDMQNKQFEQSLALQRSQSLASLNAYTQTTNQATQTGQNQLGTFNQVTTTNPNSQFGVGQSTAASSNPQLTGQITRRPEDEMVGAINPIASRDQYDRFNPMMA
jgi:hypothetical protein